MYQKFTVQIIDIFRHGHARKQLGDRQPFHKYYAPCHEKKLTESIIIIFTILSIFAVNAQPTSCS